MDCLTTTDMVDIKSIFSTPSKYPNFPHFGAHLTDYQACQNAVFSALSAFSNEFPYSKCGKLHFKRILKHR
jgi:hypothetical protein